MEDKLLTTSEVAQRLGITAGRVRQMVLAGQLPSEKLGRDLIIRESALALVSDRKPGRPPLKSESKVTGRAKPATKKAAKPGGGSKK